MKRLAVIVLALGLVFCLAAALYADKKTYKKMPSGTFTLKSKGGIDFYLGVPKSYNPSKGSPFMLCLHGDGIRDANDNKTVWSAWVASAVSAGFVVCAPKSPGQNWAGGTRALTGLIEELEDVYKLNIREYVALGHSSGASVAFELALSDNKKFSAFGSMGGRLQVNEEKVKKAGNFGAHLVRSLIRTGHLAAQAGDFGLEGGDYLGNLMGILLDGRKSVTGWAQVRQDDTGAAHLVIVILCSTCSIILVATQPLNLPHLVQHCAALNVVAISQSITVRPR